MTEHTLPFDPTIVPQETPWDCGPASTQVLLNSRGVTATETELIREIGTTVNGTDSVSWIVDRCLAQRLPDAGYRAVFLPDDPPTSEQRDELWRNVTRSLDAGYPVIMNWVAPPSNYPRGVKGSATPAYRGGTIFHYVCCVGYDDQPDARAVLIADSGFYPFQYWISFDQAATLIPPKGYCCATAVQAPVPAVAVTPPAPATTDTLFADVSEWQAPVDDSYPYQVLSIRVSDGHHRDQNFAQNYGWMRRALDSGRLAFGIIYTYVRPADWSSNSSTVRDMIDTNGGLHPRVALMLDVESGGNSGGNQSGAINALYWDLAAYAGDAARIIGYGNTSDLNTMWPDKPPGIRLIVAGYGVNPDYPGKIAHQYTDGSGYSPDLPQGCPPFGRCDMNSADGLTPQQFAAACGITTDTTQTDKPQGGPLMALTDDEQRELLTKTREIWEQLRGPGGDGWPQLGQNGAGQNLTLVDAVGAAKKDIEFVTVTIKGDSKWSPSTARPGGPL